MKHKSILFALAFMAGSSVVHAVDYTVNAPGTTNDWNVAAWSPAPGTWTDADKAFILAGAVNWTPGSHADSTLLNKLEVKASSGGTTLNISSYLKTWTGLVMNWHNTGTATINHSAGEYRLVGNAVYDSTIGWKGADNTAIYNLTGTGEVKTPGRLHIGRESSGIMNINGGALNVWGDRLYIATEIASTGTVNLTSGLLKYTSNSGYLGVGRKGHGTINQTGGVLWLTGFSAGVGADLQMGVYPEGSGTYTISGGSITNESGHFSLITNVTFVVDGSGADYIDLNNLNVHTQSTFRINLDAGGGALVKGSTAITLGGNLELDTISGFNGAVSDTYDLFWTQTGMIDTNDMIFANLSGIADFELGIVAKDGGDVLQATVVALNYDYASWAAGWGVDIGSETADYDSDGLSNLYEFGLDGDPTNEFDQGTSPTFEVVDAGGSNVFSYVHPQRPNLTYYLELNTDLIAGTWVNSGYMISGTNVTGGVLDFVTNTTDTVADEKFIRLIIE